MSNLITFNDYLRKVNELNNIVSCKILTFNTVTESIYEEELCETETCGTVRDIFISKSLLNKIPFVSSNEEEIKYKITFDANEYESFIEGLKTKSFDLSLVMEVNNKKEVFLGIKTQYKDNLVICLMLQTGYTGGKHTKPNKIIYNGRKYNVHKEGRKHFIKSKGEKVWLSTIRGKYKRM